MKQGIVLVAALSLAVVSPGCREQTTIVHEKEWQAPPPPAVRLSIDMECGRLADELAVKLPTGAPLAVLPFTDADGGVRRLGVIAADNLQRLLTEKGLQVIDRQHLNALLTERNLQLSDVGSGKSIKEAAGISGAEILIVGSAIEADTEILLTAKAIDVQTGRVIAVTETVAIPAAGFEHLMWYVRRPAAPLPEGDLPPLAVHYQFVSPAEPAEIRLDEGSTVSSGQKFKIRVQPNSDCYLYVLLYDSAGAASVLFPHSQIALSNQVRGGVYYEIPETNKWYWFDNRPGTETFYIVASYTPLADLDQMLAQMRQAGAQAVGLASAAKQQIDGVITRGMSSATSSDYQPKGLNIRTRGVGGVVDLGWGAPPEKSTEVKTTQRIDDVVVGHATVVKKLTLKHR